MSEQSRSATTTADTPRSSAEAPSDLKEAHDLLIRGFRLMENWNDAEASAIIAPNYTNAAAAPEPPPARAPGIAGVRATYDWLHTAYEDLHWTLHTVVAEGEWVVARTTMSGRQWGPFVTYTPDGLIAQAFPATGRPFAVTQSHWYRIAGHQLVEHQADRDDLGQALQLGWFPPSPSLPDTSEGLA
jgi:predicted ester cyclase